VPRFETSRRERQITNCDSRVSLMTVPCLIIWMF
jgi:hypothetical protein